MLSSKVSTSVFHSITSCLHRRKGEGCPATKSGGSECWPCCQPWCLERGSELVPCCWCVVPDVPHAFFHVMHAALPNVLVFLPCTALLSVICKRLFCLPPLPFASIMIFYLLEIQESNPVDYCHACCSEINSVRCHFDTMSLSRSGEALGGLVRSAKGGVKHYAAVHIATAPPTAAEDLALCMGEGMD
jgi:hypothetical protein